MRGLLQPVESIGTSGTPPWLWHLPNVVIAEEEQAKKTAMVLSTRTPKATAILFTDGSRHGVQVDAAMAGTGAAAVGNSQVPPGDWVYTLSLSNERVDIFDMELWAIQIGLQACLEISLGNPGLEMGYPVERQYHGRALGARWQRIELFSDSQVALQQLQVGWKRDRAPGQDVCIRIRHTLQLLQEQCPGVQVTLRWVPAHTGVPGNEEADRHANRAAAMPAAPIEVPYSQSKARQDIDQHTLSLSYQTWTMCAPGHLLDLSQLLIGAEYSGTAEQREVYIAALDRWILAAWRLRYPTYEQVRRRVLENEPAPQEELVFGLLPLRRSETPEMDLSSIDAAEWTSDPESWEEESLGEEVELARARGLEEHQARMRQAARVRQEEDIFNEEGPHLDALRRAEAALQQESDEEEGWELRHLRD